MSAKRTTPSPPWRVWSQSSLDGLDNTRQAFAWPQASAREAAEAYVMAGHWWREDAVEVWTQWSDDVPPVRWLVTVEREPVARARLAVEPVDAEGEGAL